MIDRRQFIKSAGTVSAASLLVAAAPRKSSADVEKNSTEKAGTGLRTWLFWDLWHLDRIEHLELCQGEATWRPEGTFVDPLMFGHNSWPTVYRDRKSGKWRMLYSVAWKPFTLMLAESEDGIRWKPSSQPDIKPPGNKLAAHHLYTLESGSAGGVYLDPVAKDGRPFKIFAHQQGEPVFRRALANPKHRWHPIARAEGVKRYMNEEMTLVSRDGLNWELDPDASWGLPDWYPEPPLFGFYHSGRRRHAMTVRPGWGDRRVCIQTSEDCKGWSGPELLFQPDPLDPPLERHYGMPVFPYDRSYVGLLWVFHCSDAEPLQGFNQFTGPIDCQLAYSHDGVRFSRGLRRPFIALNPSGQHGCSVIQPSCLVEAGDEVRIYSGSGKVMHGMSRTVAKSKEREPFAILQHTLRKDGFMYLKTKGDWGRFLSKPLTLLRGEFALNAQALHGEVRYQITDLESRPVEGFTFDDCVLLKESDTLSHPLAWKAKKLGGLVNKVIRLEVKLRNARLYSFRGAYHFLDAQDRWMLDDGKAIDTALFDF